MTEFDIYAFADYSGSKPENRQKKEIALSIVSKDKKKPQTTMSYTRELLRHEIQLLLIKSEEENKRVIFGFDHSYSFPNGFYYTLTGIKWKTWGQLLDLLCKGTHELPSVGDNPRDWAEVANYLICKRLKLPKGQKGPFWGPHSSQLTKPEFPFSDIFKEKRLAEEKCSKTKSIHPKSIYQIGGNGAVGLQSLYGIQNLAKLRHDLKNSDIELFCWPFDGWELPSSGHVLIEIYPRLFNKKFKGHSQDAEACSAWLSEQDKTNKLMQWFNPNLESDEQKTASLEGWIIGVQ